MSLLAPMLASLADHPTEIGYARLQHFAFFVLDQLIGWFKELGWE